MCWASNLTPAIPHNSSCPYNSQPEYIAAFTDGARDDLLGLDRDGKVIDAQLEVALEQFYKVMPQGNAGDGGEIFF